MQPSIHELPIPPATTPRVVPPQPPVNPYTDLNEQFSHADLERHTDVQRAFQIVERTSRIDRIGAKQIGLAKIRAGQDRAVQPSADQIRFDEIGVCKVGSAQIRVHEIGGMH